MALHRAPRIGQPVKIRHDVQYHIDYDWWDRTGRDLRVYLQSHLCKEHQELFSDYGGEEQIDWIDPRTAEVRLVDGLEHTLHTHCSLQEEYITSGTSLVDAVFRVFLANGNSPLTADELASIIGQRPETIGRTLGGGRIYKGLRPAIEV